MSKKKKPRRKAKPKPDPTQAALSAVERAIGGPLVRKKKTHRK